jgi:gliding motility-associated-like protein
VVIKLLPVVQISGNTNICAETTLKLSVSNLQQGTEYIWNGPSTINVNAAAIEITNAKVEHSGLYTVKATKDGCITTASISMNVKSLPQIVVDGKLQICEADTLFLEAKSPNNTTYQWISSTGIIYNGNKLIISNVKPSASGAYTLKAISAEGCTTTLTKQIKVLSLPVVAIYGKKAICEKDSLFLNAANADGAASYKWFTPAGNSSNGTDLKFANMQKTHSGLYHLRGEKDGCFKTDSVQVIVTGLPSAELKGATVLCENENLELETNDDDVTATWMAGNSILSKNNKLHLKGIKSNNAGNYILITGKDGCANSKSFAVNVKTVNAAIKNAKELLCENDSLVLNAVDAGTGANYFWKGPGVNGKNQVEIISSVKPSHGGKYTLQVVKDGCEAFDDFTVQIKSKPDTKVTGELSICEKAPLHLEAKAAGNASYKWMLPDGSTILNGTIDIASSTKKHNGKYIVQVAVDGCSEEIEAVVKIKNLPNAKIMGEETVCEGLSLQLLAEDAGDNAVYNWILPGDAEVSGTSLKIAPVQLVNSGLYKLEVNKDGCKTSVQKSLTVNPRPDLVINGKTDICESSALELNAGDAGKGSNYKWTLPNGTVIENPNLLVADMKLAGTGGYTLSVTRNGCTVASTANVFVKPLPVATITAVDALCELETLELKAASTNTATSFEWSGPATISTVGDALEIKTVTAANSGIYKLIARLNGCETVYTKNVKVKALPRPIIQGKNSICEGTAVDLYSVDAGADAIFTWTTPTNQKTNDKHLILPDAGMNATGLYKLQVNFDGCTSYDSMHVTINKMPAVSIVPSDAVCQYAPVFQVNSKEMNGVNGKGIFSGSVITAAGEVRTGAAGEFAINYTYTSNAGCVANAAANIKIKPGIKVSAGSDLVQYENEGIQLNAIVSGQYQQLTWSGIQGITATTLNPIVKPENSTSYTINVINEYGCSAKDDVFVKVVRMKIPNAFSPNNDGINDKWTVEALKDYVAARMDIFDRSGRLIYSAKGPNSSWDGKINGTPASEGTYYYVININDGKERKPISGWVQILR